MDTTTNHYDLIVVGHEIAGLVAAALVARRGKRVLVLPHGPVEGTCRLLGRTLDLETMPAVSIDTPCAQKVWAELGLVPQIRREHGIFDAFIHLDLEGQRLDLEPGASHLEAEMHRAFPTDGDLPACLTQRDALRDRIDPVLDALFDGEVPLTDDGYFRRRSLARRLSQLPAPATDDLAPLAANHPLRSGFAAALPWLCHLDPRKLGAASRIRVASSFWQGPLSLPGGLRRLREVLLQRIELHSGEVKPELRVAELTFRRSRVSGIHLLGKRDRYGCDHMIVAGDPTGALAGLLPEEELSRAFVASLSGVRPIAHRFVMHLEVDPRGIGPGFSGTCLMVPEHGDLFGTTYVQTRRRDQTPGLVTVTRILEPDTDLTDLREVILDELDRRGVLPFVSRHLRLSFSPHDGRPPSLGTAESRAADGSHDPVTPARMSPIYTADAQPYVAFGLVPQRTGVRNLILASRLCFPGFGLEGEFAVGLSAAATVATERKTPLRRSILLGRT